MPNSAPQKGNRRNENGLEKRSPILAKAPENDDKLACPQTHQMPTPIRNICVRHVLVVFNMCSCINLFKQLRAFRQARS